MADDSDCASDAPLTCYLAPRGLSAELLREIESARLTDGSAPKIIEAVDRLIVTSGPPVEAHWAQNVWRDCREFAFASIGEAAGILRGMGRNWARYSIGFHRRSELIQARLPRWSQKPLRFLQPLPSTPMGGWTLLDRNTLLATQDCSSPLPHGEAEFLEDKTAPPSRAYLKLWELFTVHGLRPAGGERCADLGSAPGGWTWVLQVLGCRVLSVDKAPLDPRIAELEGVAFQRQSAFALAPEDVGPVDWMFSDVVCYPERLYDLVLRWLDSGLCRNMVCSIKFQGAVDHDMVARFSAIPGSRIVHLHHNKHELTWYRTEGLLSSNPTNAAGMPRQSRPRGE